MVAVKYCFKKLIFGICQYQLTNKNRMVVNIKRKAHANWLTKNENKKVNKNLTALE